ncbi:MAG: helix-turn-helix transcriptional regulator [Acidobacteriota bacterium]
MTEKKRGGFAISAVADQYGIHPQTLRSYEREGLLRPSRTKGNTRFYTERDLEQLELILTLTRELGVNLAGVEVVLHMRRKMQEMHDDVEQLVKYLQAHPEWAQGKSRRGLVPAPPLNLQPVRKSKC